MICVCILALISSICFGLQNDEKTKNSGTIKISAKEDFTYIPNEQRVIYVSEEDVMFPISSSPLTLVMR